MTNKEREKHEIKALGINAQTLSSAVNLYIKTSVYYFKVDRDTPWKFEQYDNRKAPRLVYDKKPMDYDGRKSAVKYDFIEEFTLSGFIGFFNAGKRIKDKSKRLKKKDILNIVDKFNSADKEALEQLEGFIDPIYELVDMCNEYVERELIKGNGNPGGKIFLLKNNHNYSDRIEHIYLPDDDEDEDLPKSFTNGVDEEGNVLSLIPKETKIK
jgi:hypothetical protein